VAFAGVDQAKIVPPVQVHVHIPCRGADEPVPRFAHPQLVSGRQELVEVVLLGGDVLDDHDDVDDRLGCQAGHRRRPDVFDLDARPRQSVLDARPVGQVHRHPSLVGFLQTDVQSLGTPDQFERRDVGSTRFAVHPHQVILAGVYVSFTRGPAMCRGGDRRRVPLSLRPLNHPRRVVGRV